jgi:hypothetical protein
MRPRPSLPKFLGWLCLLVVLLVPSLARAQTITLDPANPRRQVDLNAHKAQPYWISSADCLNDDTFTFNVTIQGTVTGSLEVWASITGANCAESGNRTSTATNPVPCYPVYYSVPQGPGSLSVPIRVRDMVDTERVAAASSIGHGDATNCEPTDTSGAAITVDLYFLLIQSGTGANNFTGAAPTYQTKYDLAGPPPPTGVTAGVGENSLFVHWTASANPDLIGYTIYCAPASAAPAGTAGAGGDQGAGGAAGGTESAGGTDTGGTDTGGTSTAGTAGTAGHHNIDQNCYSPDLFAGELPGPSAFPCGTGNGSTQSEGQAKGLQNDQRYVVGVVGFDQVNNIGPLSNVACATPQLVDDFFDRYRAAGGKAGGGFCTIQRYASPWAALLLVGASVAYALRRRRPGH